MAKRTIASSIPILCLLWGLNCGSKCSRQIHQASLSPWRTPTTWRSRAGLPATPVAILGPGLLKQAEKPMRLTRQVGVGSNLDKANIGASRLIICNKLLVSRVPNKKRLVGCVNS